MRTHYTEGHCEAAESEQFTTWDRYDETVKGLVCGFIEKLKHYEQVAIWLQTDAGLDALAADGER